FCLIITIILVFYYSTTIDLITLKANSTIEEVINKISLASPLLINTTFRSILLGLTYVLGIVVPFGLMINEKHFINIKDYKEVLYFVLFTVLGVLAILPIYVPQFLFGYTNIKFKAWSLPHFMWLLLIAVIFVCLYFGFRHKSKELQRLLCLFLSLCLLLGYNEMFGAITLTAKRLPFQLCNIAAFFIPLTLITNNRHLFNFTMITNVAGVLFALAVPDLSGQGLFYLYNMHFVIEHTNIIIVPLLIASFKLFDRIDLKSLKEALIGFGIYFVSVWLLGTVFNSIALSSGNEFWSSNYLFMFDKEVAAGVIGDAANLFDIQIVIGNFIVYPVIQILVFLVLASTCVAVYFLFKLVYLIEDKISLRLKAKKVN
ncbi:MAG: YwaF family protein, partial [Clostridiales bacterium]|nr:YwaF family protein [Candidatus Apopatousia equi]